MNPYRITAIAMIAALASAPAAAQKGTPPRPTHQSWTTDRVELTVGDIVTVQVDERLLASAENRTVAGDERSRAMGFGVEQNIGMAGISPQASIKSDNNGSSTQTGQASRSNRFVGEISARVVAVAPSGLLQVKGTKVLKLDKTTEELTLTGWVRPEDVSSRNVVESARIAEAALEYHSSGGLEKPKGHLLLRILGWFWP